MVIDGLGGAVGHPTPHVAEGTYEEKLVAYGWTAMNATLVSEPSYTPTFEEVLASIYEHLLYLEISPKLRLVGPDADIENAKANGEPGTIFGLQSARCTQHARQPQRLHPT